MSQYPESTIRQFSGLTNLASATIANLAPLLGSLLPSHPLYEMDPSHRYQICKVTTRTFSVHLPETSLTSAINVYSLHHSSAHTVASNGFQHTLAVFFAAVQRQLILSLHCYIHLIQPRTYPLEIAVQVRRLVGSSSTATPSQPIKLSVLQAATWGVSAVSFTLEIAVHFCGVVPPLSFLHA
jgi:hypothetical protein